MYEAYEILFRPFRLDVENEKLWQGQRHVALRPKTFAVLRYLIERAGRLVSKEELLDAVWPATTVSDVVPIVCVRELRKALGDDAEAPRFIETLARRGYRFIAPLTAAPRPNLASSIRSLASERHRRGSLVQTPDPRRQTLDVPLVGRDSELARLYRLLDRALSGERQMIFISGEAGIGKTALVDAFLKRLETRDWQLAPSSPPSSLKPQALRPWLAHSQCIEQHGEGEAYLPLLEVTGRMCREPDGQGLIEILRQHAPTWLMQFPSLLSAADIEALQRKTLGATRERMLREMAEAMEVIALKRPFVLVLEDLHWCDASTLDFLAFLARRRGPAPLLVIGTYRPADLADGGHPLATLTHELSLHHQCEEIAVPLLTQGEVGVYLDLRFPPELRDGMPLDTLAYRLHQRTDGNPLFLTNVVDYLIAHGNKVRGESLPPSVDHMLEVVPQNLQQMIEKQIERLSPEDQKMIEVASVVGVEFSAAALATGLESDVVEVEERCRELTRRGQFLRARGIEEWQDRTTATRYYFIHSLYQQVVYQRVTGARSARLHLRIGTRIEEGCRGQTKENAVALARHFTLGRDYRRAVQYLHQAEENAVWRCAFEEANTHFAKGVELLRHWPDTPERTQQELLLYLTVIGPLMASKGEASPEVEHSYTQIIKLHQRLGATEVPFLVLLGLWMVRLVRGELAAAEEVAVQMMQQAEREKEPLIQLWAHLVVGICAFYRGNFTVAHAHFVQEAALYETQQHPQYLLDPKMLGLSLDSLTLGWLGHLDLALKHSQEAVAWAYGLSHPYNEVAALTCAAWLRLSRREGEAAEEQIDAMLPVAQAQGFIQYIAIGMLLQGCARVEHRQDDEGVRLMFQGIEATRATKLGVGMSAWQGLLASALGDSGRADEALAMLAEAESMMDRSGERFFEAELYRIKGELLREKEEKQRVRVPDLQPLSPDSEGEAEMCFLKAIEIAHQQRAKSLELRAVMSLIRLRQHQAAEQGARIALADTHKMLSEVYSWFTEGFETVDLREARELLEELEESSQ